MSSLSLRCSFSSSRAPTRSEFAPGHSVRGFFLHGWLELCSVLLVRQRLRNLRSPQRVCSGLELARVDKSGTVLAGIGAILLPSNAQLLTGSDS